MRKTLRLIGTLAILLAPALTRAAPVALTVQTWDGLTLGLDAQGAIQSVSMNGTQLPVLGAGGFFISEVLASQTPLPYDGSTRAGTAMLGVASATGDNQVTVSGIMDALGVSFTAVITGGPALDVKLNVTSTRSADRAFVAYFRVPVNGAGGTWATAMDNARTVGTSRIYDSFDWFHAYRTSTSASSVATMTVAGTAMTLAMPPASPFVYRLTYQPPYGFQVEWEFGVAPEPSAFPLGANLEALLYTSDPAWGYRAAIKRLYLLYPDMWTKRAQDGTWFLDEGGLTSISVPEDFALKYSETNDWDSTYTKTHGIYSMKYTEPWNDHLETDPTTLQTWAQDNSTNATAKTMISKGEPREVTAQAALLSGVIGRDGQYAGYSDPTYFTDPSGNHRYVLNPDVGIPNWLGFTANAVGLAHPDNREQAVEDYEIYRRWGVLPTSPSQVYDGVYLDSTNTTGSGWAGWHLFNFRRQHFGSTSVPLSFDPQSAKVALTQALSSVAAMKRITDMMHARGEITMANGMPDPWIFSTGAMNDFVSPGEGYDGTLSLLREVRAASYNKPMAYLYNSSVTSAQFQHAMLYAVFPGGAGVSGNRSVYQQWAPVMKEVAAAGWEPLTFAASDDSGVLVERYGRLDAGTLHFVAHRESGSTGTVHLTLDKASLGIGSGVTLSARDIAASRSLNLVDNGTTISIGFSLVLESSAVLAITAAGGTPGPTAGETLPPAPVVTGGGGGGGDTGGGGSTADGGTTTPPGDDAGAGGGDTGGGTIVGGGNTGGNTSTGPADGGTTVSVQPPPVKAATTGCSTAGGGMSFLALIGLALAFRRRRAG